MNLAIYNLVDRTLSEMAIPCTKIDTNPDCGEVCMQLGARWDGINVWLNQKGFLVVGPVVQDDKVNTVNLWGSSRNELREFIERVLTL